MKRIQLRATLGSTSQLVSYIFFSLFVDTNSYDGVSGNSREDYDNERKRRSRPIRDGLELKDFTDDKLVVGHSQQRRQAKGSRQEERPPSRSATQCASTIGADWAGERQHGRRYLLDRLAESSRKSRGRSRGSAGRRSGKRALLLGYEVLQVHDDGDEGASVFLVWGRGR